jgi:dihydroflavonol-4-reductase
MPSQILITGATGFIGRHLARDLMRQGSSVRVLARSQRKVRQLFGDTVEIVAGHLDDTAALQRACRGIDVVYHVAGLYRFGLRHRRELWATNVEGANNLLRSAWAARVDRVVHLSSGGVLQCPGARLLEESDFPATPPRFCPYKASKWHAELRALAWARRGLPVIIASTTCPIGHGDEAPTPTGRMIRDFLARRFPFFCHTGLNFINVGDLSRGLQAAASAGRSGERYLLSDQNLWLKEFLDLLAAETGLPAPRLRLPGALIAAIGCGGEMLDLLASGDGQARVCIETALQSRHRQFFTNAKARRELGWKATTSLRDSIHEAVAWFRHGTERGFSPAPAPVESHAR